MATCSRAHLKFGGSIFVSVRSLFYLTLSIFPLTVINSSSCEHYCEIQINTYQYISHVQECFYYTDFIKRRKSNDLAINRR